MISALDLAGHLHASEWVVIDCRYSLQNHDQGRHAYLQEHIPGAVYADLENDLSGTIDPGKTGRHPLPNLPEIVERFSRWGIDETVQVVVYDDQGGSVAARLWWLLNWLGHETVAVLDGGWQQWVAAGYQVEYEVPIRERKKFLARINREYTMETEQIAEVVGNQNWLLVDARVAHRFFGINETIDPVAGHIPSAVSIPYDMNLTETGMMKSPADLRQIYQKTVEKLTVSHIVMYCGSGVTAAFNILAMRHAGLGMCKLYPGSWSEWITDPTRPIAK